MGKLIFVDCEGEWGKGAPSVGRMTEFGAVDYDTHETFHGIGDDYETIKGFLEWLNARTDRPIFVTDNVAYDWQWINDAFWRHFGFNPFGHSARRIGDFYAGLVGNFWRANEWKKLRVTKHDHNPVHDAMGNAEAFKRIMNGERA